ncbi:MAG: hypothetical protein R2911_17790 [Caldilineaceae bacterium]
MGQGAGVCPHWAGELSRFEVADALRIMTYYNTEAGGSTLALGRERQSRM